MCSSAAGSPTPQRGVREGLAGQVLRNIETGRSGSFTTNAGSRNGVPSAPTPPHNRRDLAGGGGQGEESGRPSSPSATRSSSLTETPPRCLVRWSRSPHSWMTISRWRSGPIRSSSGKRISSPWAWVPGFVDLFLVCDPDHGHCRERRDPLAEPHRRGGRLCPECCPLASHGWGGNPHPCSRRRPSGAPVRSGCADGGRIRSASGTLSQSRPNPDVHFGAAPSLVPAGLRRPPVGARLREELRRKLGDDASSPAYIFNERQVGYRMPKPGNR